MIPKRSFILYALLLAGLIAIDQLSKYTVRAGGASYICNSGIAFGLPLPAFLFWTFWSAAIALLFVVLYRKNLAYGPFFAILILAGALSNILDRAQFGCVTDFIDIKFWPIFNLADIYITIGVILLTLNISRKN